VPEPSSANGKVLVRLPKTLHAELLQTAKREQTSLNQYIVSALTAATTAHSLQRFITHHLSSASELTTRAWPVSVSFPENSPQRGITGWITGLAPGTAVTPIRGTHTHIASGTAGTVTYTARTADIRSRLPKLIEVMKEGQHG